MPAWHVGQDVILRRVFYPAPGVWTFKRTASRRLALRRTSLWLVIGGLLTRPVCAGIVGRSSWTAADALVGLLGLNEAHFVTEERVQGDPRRPGGLPHDCPRIPTCPTTWSAAGPTYHERSPVPSR